MRTSGRVLDAKIGQDCQYARMREDPTGWASSELHSTRTAMIKPIPRDLASTLPGLVEPICDASD